MATFFSPTGGAILQLSPYGPSVIHTLGFITLDSFHVRCHSFFLFFLIDECILLSKVKCLNHVSYTLSKRHISCKNIEGSGTVQLQMRVDTLQEPLGSTLDFSFASLPTTFLPK